MKLIKIFVLITIVTLVLSVRVNGQDVNEQIHSSLEDELTIFENSLPDYVKDYLPSELFNGDFSTMLDNSINEKQFFDYILDYLFFGIGEVLKSFASILALLIISSIFTILKSNLEDTSVNRAFSVCSSLCMTATVFNIVSSLAGYTSSYMRVLCSVMTAFSPLMTSIYIMNGNLSSAALSNGTIILFTTLIEGFLLAFMLPLVKMCIVFSSVKALGNEFDFSGISKTVRSTFTSVTIFIMSIFMFVFSYKSVISQSSDTLSLKTARFAISSFVPMVGASVNEALRTLSSSVQMIKASCGAVALIAIALIILPIIIYLFLNKLSFNLLSAVSSVLGCQREAEILSEADSTCVFMLTLVCSASVLFVIALTVFIKSSQGALI